MAEHAKLMSPSSAARRIACPGSYVLESALPDKSSDASDDGTAMHWVGAECLFDGTRDAASFVGRYIDVHDAGQPVRRVQFDRDMAELVQTYIDEVRRRSAGRELQVEQKVDFSSYVEMPAGSQFGTLDNSIVFEDEKVLEVGDFKSGYRRVEVVRNPQLMLYALGSLERVRMLYDIERVRLAIYQPKVSETPGEWECTVDELMQFAELARRATHECEAAEWNMKGGGQDFAEKYLRPGDDQCQFCKAAATCPALRGVAARVVTFNPARNEAALDDFQVIDPIGPVEMEQAPVVRAIEAMPQLTGDQLGRLLQIAPLIETWLKALLAEGDRRLLAGQVVPGFKVVAGKKGARKWADPEAVEAQLKAMRLKVEEMYDLKLISPTTAEKLTKPGEDGKPALGPRQWQKLQALITQADGKPSVVPVTDKRPALQIAPPADDFEVIKDTAPQGAEALV